MQRYTPIALLGWLLSCSAIGAAPAASALPWSFVSPTRPALPQVVDASWTRNAIDRFVLARLEQEGITPSPQAEPAELIRRVTLDLTGVPPEPATVDDFLGDSSPGAYEKVVDRMLASPRFGERAAMEWLDLARFADTDGYSEDHHRSMWLWRDWVIDALNSNQSFDQFTIDQLAGDLLPDATVEQRIATGFNRNHRINREPGSIPEEFRIEYVVDRVDTTSTVWLGLTMVCARCHDHKYDPISQRDFYRLFAFFNNVPEVGNGGGEINAPPMLRLSSDAEEMKLKRLDEGLAAARKKLEELKKAESSTEALDVARKTINTIKDERKGLLRSIPSTMVMADLEKPRDTFVLERGQYDQPGEAVQPGVPSELSPLPEGAPVNRLGLARWLVSSDHPLTARVAVNRYWQRYFGAGLVKTDEDFGTQGELPSHPQLLDWLATEFVRTGWDVKALQRRIVTSATYRQSSRTTALALRRDPENRRLGRASRLRLPAELIRDQALAASGLLAERLGGPSVKPYQPPGVWDGVAYKLKYVPDEGEALYRRSLYIYWKRTVPPPAMTTFDAPSRETCKTRRSRTNTPLQALMLMNDRTYVEAAAALAQRILRAGDVTAEERLRAAFRRVLVSPPRPAEFTILKRALERYGKIYRERPRDAERLTAVLGPSRDESLDVSELAAYTAVCSVLFNLDKAITRE